MNTNRQTANKERKMKITTPKLIRWAGLSAMVAGIIFAGIQPIHPPDVLASVNTSAFIIITSLKTAMCLFGLFGIAGLYARHVEETGWLGLAGYLLFGLFFALTAPFQFIEAVLTPVLATAAPKFVEGWLGVVTAHASEINLGAVPTIYAVTGLSAPTRFFADFPFADRALLEGPRKKWSAQYWNAIALHPPTFFVTDVRDDRVLRTFTAHGYRVTNVQGSLITLEGRGLAPRP